MIEGRAVDSTGCPTHKFGNMRGFVVFEQGSIDSYGLHLELIDNAEEIDNCRLGVEEEELHLGNREAVSCLNWCYY